MSLTGGSFLAYANFTGGAINVAGLDRPGFARASTDWVYDMVEGRFIEVPAGVPNFSGEYEPDQYRTPFLRVPPSAAQQLQKTNVFDTGSTWSNQADFTITEVEGVFRGWSGWLHEDKSGGASNFRDQTTGSWSGSPEMTIAIVENLDATTTSLEARDGVGAVIGADYTWATDAMASFSGSGAFGRRILSEHGPNGGRVVLLWVRGDGTGARTLRIYPVDRGTDTTNAVIIHHIGHVQAGFLMPPVVRDTGAVTRAAAELTYKGLSAPIVPLAVYLNMVLGGEPSATQRGILTIGSTTGTSAPYLRILRDVAATVRLSHANGTDAAVERTVSPGDPGDRIELLAILKSTGAVRLLTVKNDNSIQDSGDSSAPAAGLASQWASPQGLTLGNKGNLTDLSSEGFGILKVLKANDLASAIDGTENADLMREVRLAHLTHEGHFLVSPV